MSFRYYSDEDCETCVNFNTHLCDECEYYAVLYDHYEPASQEIIAKKEAERRERAENSLPHEFIRVNLPDEFKKVFEAVKPFCGTETHRPELFAVHVGEDYLSATNTHVLAHIKRVVPEDIRGKNILRIDSCLESDEEGDQVKLLLQKVFWEDQGLDYFVQGNSRTVSLSEIKIVDDADWKDFKTKRLLLSDLSDTDILFNAEYLDLALKTLAGDISITYTGAFNPVIFSGDNGWVVVMPLRL